LGVADDRAGALVQCPQCGSQFRAPAVTSPPVPAAAPIPSATAPLGETSPSPTGELSPKRRKRRRRSSEQLRGLAWLSHGLAFHYVSVLVLLAGIIAAWVGLGAFAVGLVAPTIKPQPVVFLANVAATGLLLLALVIDFPCLVLGLLVPDGRARLLLLLAVLPRLGILVDWGWLMWLSQQRDATVPSLLWPWALVPLGLIAAVILWLAFLRRVALLIRRDEIADHALVLMGTFVRTLLAQVGLPALVLGVVVLLKFFLCFGIFAAAGMVAAVIRILMVMESFDSLWEAFLFPTGVPFMLQYLDFVGSLRHVLVRKTEGKVSDAAQAPVGEEADTSTVDAVRPPRQLLSTGLILGLVAVLGVLLLVGSGVLLFLVLPVIEKVQGVTDSIEHQKKLQRLALAMHAYHDTYGSLPPAVFYDEAGQPLHSWRVLVLPFLEQDNLYRQVRLTEPWNSPHNRPLLESAPPAFAAPRKEGSRPTTTPYQVFAGPDAAFESSPQPRLQRYHVPGRSEEVYIKHSPLKIASFTDGTANTLLIVQAPKEVAWAEPLDLPFEEPTIFSVFDQFARQGFNAALADGSARRFPPGLDRATLRALVTPHGDEVLPAIPFDTDAPPQRR
jgi:hypothetical protein